MDISFLDLRRKPSRILEALKRRETVTISRRGRAVARVLPVDSEATQLTAEHPAFGMWADRADMENVDIKLRELRRGRFDAL